MNKLLKVALLLDDGLTHRSLELLASWSNERLDIDLAIVSARDLDKGNDEKSKRTNWPARFLWGIIMFIERKRINGSQRTSDLKISGFAVNNINRGYFKSPETDRVLSRSDAEKNILLKFGRLPLPENINRRDELLIVEVCFDNGPTFRGAIPGFWEVLFGEDKTHFSIHELNSEGKIQRILARGSIPTQKFFLLNQEMLLDTVDSYLKGILLRMASGETPLNSCIEVPFSGRTLDRPTFLDMSKYCIAILRRSLRAKVSTVLKREEKWGISCQKVGWKSTSLSDGVRIENPNNRYFADPFLLPTAEGCLCFVEDYLEQKGKGVISVLNIDDPVNPIFIGQAIEEDFHLSFPYIFKYEGEIYMCPETHQARQIRIYRCTSLPLEWELVSIAMDGISAVDTMLFERGGMWWMLTNIDPLAGAETFTSLSLFSAPSPLSTDWVPHPMNPLIVDPEFGRNAGILRDGDRLFRVSQARTFGKYGAYANVSEIEKIGLTNYRERVVTSLHPDFKPGVSGLHHFHSAGGYSVWDHKCRD